MSNIQHSNKKSGSSNFEIISRLLSNLLYEGLEKMSLYQVHYNKTNRVSRALNFKDLLWEAIDYSFLKIFDEVCRSSTYNFLREDLEKFHLPEEINEFLMTIEKLFGFGSKLIEIYIMEYLNSRVENSTHIISLDVDFSLSEYIVAFKHKFFN